MNIPSFTPTYDYNASMVNEVTKYGQDAYLKGVEDVFDLLKDMHIKTNGKHNFYLHAVVSIRDRLLGEK